MDTSVGYRSPRAPRVPLDEVMIRLAPEGFHEEFEADGLNMGVGGLSVRAAVLPEVGSRLRCEFEAADEGVPIQVVGEVVWAHESGPYMGEFGVRFRELAEPDHDRIAEIVYRWQRQTRTDPEHSPTVRLALEGVASPIIATLTTEDEAGIEVEQPLPFLTIGTTVENETTGRKGRLSGVELRLERDTPRLVLTIGYQDPEVAIADDDAMDTIPDPEDLHDEPPRVVVHGAELTDEELEAPEALPPKAAYSAVLVRGWNRLKPVGAHLVATGELGWSRIKRGAHLVRRTYVESVYPRCRDAIARAWTVSSRFARALLQKDRGEPRRRQQRPRGGRAPARTKPGRLRIGLAAAVLSFGVIGTAWWLRADAPSPPTFEAPPEVEIEEPVAAPEATQEPAPTAVAPTPVDGIVFGAASVPNGEKFVLRMSNPVTRLEGVAETQGFSVTIPNSLSLSRAGPIAAEHPDVERSMILNRGDYAEFTLRFVEGRAPAYRVEAVGTNLEITIER